MVPRLAPQPISVSSVAPKPRLVLEHSDAEWTALYPTIERLYVRERRKLRYVMQYLESEHGFRATVQMYKKRLAKWGFQKNSKRLSATVCSPKTKDQRRSRKAGPTGERDSVAASPGLCHHESSMLMLLTSVRTWSVAFFESLKTRKGSLQQRVSIRGLPESNSKEVNYTFKLAIDLLDRGHGNLAGRMARKAFLLVEDMITLEGPVLVWNLLEMMHYMVTLRHTRLFQLLMAHLVALADAQMSTSHPLPVLLQGLCGITSNLARATSTPDNPQSRSPISSAPPSARNSQTSAILDPCLLTHNLPSLLEKAWILNTEIMLDNFDPRLFGLYCRLLCESCSITPPTAIIGMTDQWFDKIDEQHILGTSTWPTPTTGSLPSLLLEETR
ncbi:Fc.00g025350.m01.CDS01 [Cosmosporella sp. VM-42]